jgi:hypothetical protein
LKPFVSICEVICDSVLWVKLDRQLFNSREDIYIAFTYIPPEGRAFHSAYNIDIFDVLEVSITNYISLGNVIVMGDLNSRCGTVVDFIETDTLHKSLLNHISSILYQHLEGTALELEILADFLTLYS